jgi:LPS export ABC transporter permease LptG/LPS export ABC transporter permease LptF
MHTGGRLIERYILRAILPYLLLSLLLLTTILLTQQASRFAELLVGVGMPLKLVAEVALALIPNVLVFALPIAVLAGTVIGFSRLGSDSEMVTMRAAGVGTWRMLWPVLLLGAALSCLTLYINLWEAPQSAHSLRRTALSAALYKMDSPVEPRSFNVDIPGYVVYVRDGDKAQGQWGRVFIYSQEKDGSNRLITARSGRIDSAAEQSELVLSDAVATKIPAQRKQPSGDAYVVERLAQLRVQFNTGRAALLEKIRQDEREADELDWFELGDYAAHREGAAARDAWTLWHKRLTLSLSPLVFALLGTGLGLRVRKGGRGLGMLVSLLVLVSYYLVSLLCEQMARAGTLSVPVGAWISTALALACGIILLARGLVGSKGWLGSLGLVLPGRWRMDGETARLAQRRAFGWARKTRLLSFPSLLDLSVLRALWLSFAFSLIALTAIFLIFTLFELWRFIALSGAGARLIMKYMLFLLPLISVQLLPASVLLSVLATYALMSRRSESIAWWACGQSVYRLMLPGMLFAAITGGCLWLVQERLMPEANTKQDALRAQIRGGPLRATTKGGRQWLASPESGRLYAYTYDEEGGGLRDLAIYEFDAEGVHLTRAIKAQAGWWTKPDTLHLSGVESLSLKATKVEQGAAGEAELAGAEPPEAFKPTADKPSQLSAKGLSAYIKQMRRRGSLVATLAVALQHKYAEPFSPLVMALLGIPLAFSFGRRSAIAALCSAIGIGLAFWGVSGGFQQLGSYGLLPPAVAAWSPLVIFAAIGAYLLSRART